MSAAVDDKFRVTGDLLAKNPKEAEARFEKLLAAMTANATRLKTHADTLGEAKAAFVWAASAVLIELNKGIEKAVATGLFNRRLVLQYLDVDDLVKAFNGLAGDAEKKAKEARAVAAEQERRHDNLKATIKTVFGFEPRP